MGEEERITYVVEQLKDCALSLEVPVTAIVAAEKASLVAGKRMQVHDLRGSSALAYEADIVLILNDKYDVVARHHLVYHLDNAERFRQWVVLTIEKNRSGIDKVELEFMKRFEQGRFEREEPRGAGAAHRGAHLRRLVAVDRQGQPPTGGWPCAMVGGSHGHGGGWGCRASPRSVAILRVHGVDRHQALDVISRNPERFAVAALSAGGQHRPPRAAGRRHPCAARGGGQCQPRG